MVEFYIEPFYIRNQSVIGGVQYRNYKRQRIKFNSTIYFLDPK